jgi:probable HAF family extracellular repeat protein
MSYSAGSLSGNTFLYDGTMHDLGSLGDGTTFGGRGINATGHVTGISLFHAFLYDGTMHDLGTLGGTTSSGLDINDADQVTGEAQVLGDVAEHAFVYDGTMHDIGTLGGTNSTGWAINAGGHVTGSSQVTGDVAYHAFLYDGTMHDIGTLGGSYAFGSGINASGTVVGSSFTAGDLMSHAFVYSGASGMVDLNTLIHPLSGWELEAAFAINNVGQITGSGYFDGQYRAFLLTPAPEPATLSIVALSLLACLWREFRRR